MKKIVEIACILSHVKSEQPHTAPGKLNQYFQYASESILIKSQEDKRNPRRKSFSVANVYRKINTMHVSVCLRLAFRRHCFTHSPGKGLVTSV